MPIKSECRGFFTIWLIFVFLNIIPVSVAFGYDAEYKNKKIEEIMGLLDSNHLNPVFGEMIPLGTICPGKNLTTSLNQKGEVEHIGIMLFNRKIVADYPSPVYFFIERYLLWILLAKDETIIKERLADERVSIRFGLMPKERLYTSLRQSLALINSDQPFIITTDNSKYAITWLDEQSPILSITFPIQYELIWGMNKKEVEGCFKADLMAYLSEKRTVSPDISPTEFIVVKDSCYRSEGDYYGVPEVTSYRYYRKQNQNYALLFDKNYPAESAANLFTAIPDTALQIRITQRLYGNNRDTYTVPLAGFLDFCRAEGCEVFVGIEKKDGQHVTGTVVLVNRSLGYNHILHFDVDNRLWKEKGVGALTGQLYAFVPMHNVNSLYSDGK